MNLFDAYDDTNIFAKILRQELPCWNVFEDDVALAFLDLFPQGPGHTLVIPKHPARTILDLPTDLLGPYMARVQTIAGGVQKAFGADGLTLFQFNGSAGGQTVFHLHVHIIPRHDGIGLKGHGQSGKALDADLAEQAAAIRAALG